MSKSGLVGATLGGALALFLGAASAQSATIDGAIGFGGTFDTLAAPGSTSIVSQLEFFDLENDTNVYIQGTGVGDFATVTTAQAVDFDLSMTPFLIFLNDFDFTVFEVGSITRSPLVCGPSNNCTDTVTFDMSGVVTGAGFDPTAFFGSFTATGSCSNNTSDGIVDCDSNITATWSATLAANGVEVPEPVSLLLLGTSLVGLGVLRRRRA